MIDYHAVRNWNFGDIVQCYSRRDTMLYALGVGIGANPLDPGDLRYTYEKNLQALPASAPSACGPESRPATPSSSTAASPRSPADLHLRAA